MAKTSVNRIDKNVARRLREARREVGLSTRAVVEKLPARLKVSHVTLASYENGTSVPPVNVLAGLADIYHRTVTWFLDSREALGSFRYRHLKSRVGLHEQRQFEALVGKWIDAYFNLQKHLRIGVGPQKKAFRPAGDLDPEALAETVRCHYLDLDESQPIQNMVFVLESFSAWALELKSSFGIEGAAAKHGHEFVVVISPEVSNTRLRMNAAHELAHVLYDDCKLQLGWTDAEVEKKAHDFATSLLMPDSQLREAFEGTSFLKLIQYKERFGVSLLAMIYRAEKQQIINTTTSRWLWNEMTRRGWRNTEPGYVWRDRAIGFETMLDCAIQSKTITWSDAERITGIHEKDLRQRILDAVEISNGTNQVVTSVPDTLKFERPADAAE